MSNLFNVVFDFCNLIKDSLQVPIEFLLGLFRTLPNLFSDIFNNLPNVFQYGLSSLFGILILIMILKLVALLLSFK